MCVCACLSLCVCVLNCVELVNHCSSRKALIQGGLFRVREQRVENMTSMWLHHSSLAWRWKKEPPAKIHCPQWPCPPDHLRNPAACEKNIQEISNSQNANFNIFRVGMKMQQWVIYSITWYSRRWYIVSLVIFVKIYLFKNDTGHRSLGPGGGAWILRFPQVVSQPTNNLSSNRSEKQLLSNQPNLYFFLLWYLSFVYV